MAKRGQPDWQALLKWSAKYVDGTSPAKEWSETDREWLESALQQNMVDEVQRMKVRAAETCRRWWKGNGRGRY